MSKEFNIHCCECDILVGTTSCEITATSPTTCEDCRTVVCDCVQPGNTPRGHMGIEPDTDCEVCGGSGYTS